MPGVLSGTTPGPRTADRVGFGWRLQESLASGLVQVLEHFKNRK